MSFPHGHNGGPWLDDEPDAKLRWVRVNVTELLQGIEGLSFEERGAYLTIIFRMYATMGGFPADDRQGASALRCDVRQYRRLRASLMAAGKLYQDGAMLRNGRVEKEIADYIREYHKRRKAALEREERKRLPANFGRTSPELRGDFAGTSGQSRGEVREISGELEAKNTTKTKDAAPQDCENSATNHKPLTTNQEPITTKKEHTQSARAGELHVGSGVFVNCETVRHDQFSISLKAIEMQLCGVVPMDEIKQVAVGHALQWALDLESGKRGKVVPDNTASFIRASIQHQRNHGAVTEVRKARASSKHAPRPDGKSFAELNNEVLAEIAKGNRT